MSDPAILFVKPKAISQRDKKTLQQACVIVIEVENVADVKFTRAAAELSSSEMLLAAMKAITKNDYSSSSKQAFAEALAAALFAKQPAT